jgi:eukaryotic-like serine/threonine-protein kinase
MKLWTEYEGTTIDGSFPLTQLLLPEGRSAVFSTSNGNGVPRHIRLIESHFDEDEIIARWRGVAALNNPHLLKFEKYGLVELDGTRLIYAVMEPVDGNLGDVVSSQRVTTAESRQLASSLTSALEALHSHGFVHEHVEPASVLAVGEVVKLRSDCIRESPEGEEGHALKRRDVHDMAVVLLQALRQERTLDSITIKREPLPAPFDRIVPLAMGGQWGLTEIAAALAHQEAPQVIASPATGTRAAATVSSPPSTVQPKSPEPSESASRITNFEEDATPSAGWSTGRMVGIALALVVVLWIGWHFLHSKPAGQSNVTQATSTPTPTPAPVAATTSPASTSAPAAPVSAPSTPQAPAQKKEGATAGEQWRVVAYTYNHQDQAQHKAETIAQKHPDLQAEVFSPSGQAPYLVTLGGAMNRDDAFALVKKVRGEGLPRDTYAQNYKSRAE